MWIKLYKEQLESLDFIEIMSEKNGYEMIIFYFQLNFMSDNLQINFKDFDKFCKNLAKKLQKSCGKVVKFLQHLDSLELISLQDNRIILQDYDNLHKSKNALRQQRFRDNHKTESSVTNNVTNSVTHNGHLDKNREDIEKKREENIIYNNIDSNLNNDNSNNNEPEESPSPFFNSNKQEKQEGNQYLKQELNQIKYNIIKNHKRALRGGNSDNWYAEKWNNGGDFHIIGLFKERMYSTDKSTGYVLDEIMKAIKWMFAGGDKDSDFVRGNIVKAKNPFVSFVNNYNAFRYDKDGNYKAPTCYSKEEIIANMERNHKKYMDEHKDDD